MKVVTAYGNFAKGQIDHTMNGRFDLPIYNTGMDIFQNFISNYQGNAVFSAGFLSQVAFQDCAFVEFKFSPTQSYLCCFYAGNVQFLAFATNGTFGWVQASGGGNLVVTSPYSLADAQFISQRQSYTQNADVMYIVHRSYAPYKLTRTSANAFTLATYTRTSDPFTGAGNWPGACCFYQGRLYMASTNNNLTGVWFSNDAAYDDFTIQSPITDASGFQFTCTDITQQIEWIFPADNSLVFGATDGILACNGGAVNTAITASTVQTTLTSAEPTNGYYPFKRDGLMFYTGRMSRNIYYFRYDILTELFIAKDANLAAYDMSRGLLQKMRWVDDRYRLIFTMRGDGNFVSTVFNEPENINGWHLRTTQGIFSDIAVIGDNNGNPQLFTLVNRNGTYYIEQKAAYVEFKKRADFWTPSTDPTTQTQNESIDDEAYTRYVSEQLRQCVYADNAIQYSDLRSTTITFNPTGTDPYTGTPSGTLTSTGSDFTSSDVGRHVVYKTATGYESGRFLIDSYVSATVVNVTVLQSPVIKSAGPTIANLYVWSSWYMSFTTLNGLSQYNGMTVGIVADGGYFGTVVVSGGSITMPNQTTSMTVGLLYTGIIKSMCLGFSLQGHQTQITMKEISRMSLRCVNSMGLKCGNSPYYLEEVQLKTQNDINYLPPQPIDGTQDVEYDDNSEEDKFFYIIQDQPLPACVTSFVVEANYAVST